MLTSVDKLKERAREMLPIEVATSVQLAIEAEAQNESKRMTTDAPPDLRPYSAATLYLADKFYGGLRAGRFSGRPTIQWNGMDSFIFLEDNLNPFHYETAANRVITPKPMSTDGGSIPRFLRILRKFSPWGYAPAFIIHDWLFWAHRHNSPPDNDWSFPASSLALAECLKSLMVHGFSDVNGNQVRLEKAEDTLYLMYHAVNNFGLRIWDGYEKD